jgi:4-hydroxy-tetrahydrodipicolinate reductase
MPSLKIAVAGAAGRMGQAVIRAIAESRDAVLTGALERQGASDLGRDAGELASAGISGVTLTGDPKTALAGAEAIIDFTAPETSLALAKRAAKAGMVHDRAHRPVRQYVARGQSSRLARRARRRIA